MSLQFVWLTSRPKVNQKLPQLTEISIVSGLLSGWQPTGRVLSLKSIYQILQIFLIFVNYINLVNKPLQTLYILKRSKCAGITIYSVIIVLLILGHRHWNLNLLRLRLSLNYIGLWSNNWAMHAVVQCLLQVQLCIFLATLYIPSFKGLGFSSEWLLN